MKIQGRRRRQGAEEDDQGAEAQTTMSTDNQVMEQSCFSLFELLQMTGLSIHFLN